MAPRTAPPVVLDLDNDPIDPDHGEAWEAEIDRRIADVREGRVETVAVEDVLARIRAKHGWA
jgi:putative addiction module component (TIGR02574 family)